MAEELQSPAAALADKPLLDRLHERTAKRVLRVTHSPDYNVPPRWYMKPDGDIVQLQADPHNMAYYTEKGYTILRPDEAAEWESRVRKEVLRKQKHKASLINTIRRIGAKNPGIEIGLSDDMEIPELEQILQEVGKATGNPTGVFIGRMKDDADYDDPDPEAAGVEMGQAKEAFEEKLRKAEAQGRHVGPAPASRDEPHGLVAGTGYDATTGRAQRR